MPSLHYSVLSLPVMSDKKSPPRKEKALIVRTAQSDDKGMKRKLLSPGSPVEDDDKKTPSKRKRGSLSFEASPIPGTGSTPKGPGNVSRSVPLSERQQLAMIMKMSDETSQGAPVTDEDMAVKPMSPTMPSSMKKTMLDRKVHKRNERGELPIHLAAIKGDIKLIKKLIKAGADVNVADFAGWTPLHEACNHGRLSVAKQLLKSGANVNVQGLENDTPLHDASGNGHRKLIELLLKHGANPLQPNSKGKTPVDVAASAEMVKLLKREIISSGSDSSSLDDLRSPTSPDSVCSLKEEDHGLDLEEMSHTSRSDSFTSSTNSRRTLLPKSPDNKMASPRLCLKFQRELSGQVSQKAKDSAEPVYKSYSVTSVTVDSALNQPMFSPADSPASSIDSDLYNPLMDSSMNYTGSRLKISVGESLVLSGLAKPSMEVSAGDEAGVVSVNTVHTADGIVSGTGDSDRNSKLVTENSNKLVLKTFETRPFSPLVNWSESQSQQAATVEDLSEDLPDLEPNASSHIPRSEGIQTGFPEAISVDTVSVTGQSRYQSAITSATTTGSNNGSFVTSTNASDPFRLHSHHPVLASSHKKSNNSGSSNSVCSVSVASVNNTTSNSVGEVPLNVSSLKWDLRSSASPKSEDSSSVHSGKSDSLRTNSLANSPTRQEKPERETRNLWSNSPTRLDKMDRETRSLWTSSPTRQDKIDKDLRSFWANSPTRQDKDKLDRETRSLRTNSSPTRQEKPDRETRSTRSNSSPSRLDKDKCDRESRPSSPKVPPLKIIIPMKSASSSSESDGLKLLVTTKSALPYVINPTQDQENEKEGEVTEDPFLQSQNTSQASSPTSQTPLSPKSPAPFTAEEKKSVLENSSDKLTENVSEKLPEESAEGSEGKQEEKKEEPTQRVLRSAVRSQQQTQGNKQQQQQQQKQEKAERSSNTDNLVAQEFASITRNNKVEEEEYNIHPRKRKLRPKSDNLTTPQAEPQCPAPITAAIEKPPNPYEMYLDLRKRIAMKRQGMTMICPTKIPQGFKDYLVQTCNYVLQGNTSSTLSVPTLSPPNSVKGPIRDLFVKQESARYKLRLQHLIEREKLMLSIEQEILREHGRAARAMVNQGMPLSVCTILKDEEIYNTLEMDQADDKDKNVRSRYNGRQFLSWLQDVDDKYEKIKELLILRQKQEADSLYAVQKMEWEWRLKELGHCDRNTTPAIDELHVPLVQVTDNFDLLPT